MQRVKCDKCSDIFKITLVTTQLPNEVEKNYFTCPTCKEEYITHVTDRWARKEQKEIRAINEKLNKRKRRLQSHMEELKNQIQKK